MIFSRFFMLFLFIFPLAGCVATQFNQLDAKLDRTNDMISTGRSETHAEIEEIKTEIEGLKSRIDHLSKVQADLMISMDEYQMTMRGLSNNLNQVTQVIDSTKNMDQSPVKHDLDGSDHPVDIGDQQPEQLYQTAYNDYVNRKYDLAIVEFQSFLNAFSESDLADNSQYWLGECFYAQRKYEEAKEEFNKVIMKYPSGDKVVPALLKKGLCSLELGDDKAARNLLEELVRKYPFSEEARVAEDRLKEMKRK